MVRRSPILRALLALFAALELALPGAATWADAYAPLGGGRSGAAGSRIESGHLPDCPRSHPADCALCRYLTGRPDPDRTGPAVVLPAIARDRAAPRPERAAPPLVVRLPLSRAPPRS